MAVHGIRDEIRQQIRAVFHLALSSLALAALLLPMQTGEVGVFINNVLRMLTGDMAVVVPFLLVIHALQMVIPWKLPNLRQRMAGMFLILVILLVHAHLNAMGQNKDLVAELGILRAGLQLGYRQQGGGVAGALASVLLYYLFRDVGSIIILLALSAVAFLLITNISLTQLVQTFCKCLRFGGQIICRAAGGTVSLFRFLLREEPADGPDVEDDEEYELPVKTRSGKRNAETAVDTVFTEPQTDKPHKSGAGKVVPFPMPQSEPQQPALEEKTAEKQNNSIVVNVIENPPGITIVPPTGDYVLPPLTLLSKMPRMRDNQQQKSIAERARILEKTLDSFGVKVKVTEYQTGPTVTRFELQPETGVKVSKIVALADDLALNLAASDVRIEAPIPGKAAVGIEVPNKVIASVYLRDVLEDEQFLNASSPLTIGLGKDITGNPVFADLMKMPHLLIAGSTGSGKSVCINVLIASILFKARPEEVKFVMIDPKVVELSAFNGIPHLLMPVVTEPKKASLALRNMLKEMSRRYELFARETVRDIHSYNQRMREDNLEGQMLPYIVVIIDELADLMMVAAADVEDSIARLAQMSRAAGIHLVIATQRPSVDVITGVIKANITSRIAFAVSSMADSRTILDMGGAEKLLGRGDALFHPLGVSKPYRIQGAYINERELNELLEYIKNQGEPQFAEQLMCDEEDEEDGIYEEDEKFGDALMLVAEAGTASVSLLQRRLRIGYTRAARIIDDMERRGFIGRFEGSKAREVLITPAQVTKLLFENETDNPIF